MKEIVIWTFFMYFNGIGTHTIGGLTEAHCNALVDAYARGTRIILEDLKGISHEAEWVTCVRLGRTVEVRAGH